MMYEQPTKQDLDRNLSAVLHAARHRARDEKGRLVALHASRGTLESSMFVSDIVQCADKAHIESVQQAMNILHEFGGRMNVPAHEIVASVKPHLDNIATTLLLGTISPQGPAHSMVLDAMQRARVQYEAVFKQRIEGALRDFEIGFIDGRDIRPGASPARAPTKEIISLKPGWLGFSIDLKEIWRRFRG
jgi:hypothetical protein